VRSLTAAAKSALVSVTSAAGMMITTQTIRMPQNIAHGFITRYFVNDMNLRVIDAIFAAIDTASNDAKASLGFILALGVSVRKWPESNMQSRVATLLQDTDPIVKVSMLKIIKRFPPSLA
jgi:hypothetical protein